VSRACEAAGIHRSTAYDTRKADESFHQEWKEAIETACDAMELEARRRAKDGIEEPVFYRGKKCGVIKRYSDQLLIFLLRANRPEKYRERISVYTGPELDEETMRLFTDEEVKQAAAGKLSGEQIAAIITARKPQGGGAN
jgi:hypothetical protein